MKKFFKVFGHSMQAAGIGVAAAILTQPEQVSIFIPPKYQPWVLGGSAILNTAMPSLVTAIRNAAAGIKPKLPAPQTPPVR